MNIDDIFNELFLKEVSEKEKKKNLQEQEKLIIANQKKKKLFVIEQFLKKFVDMRVIVNSKDKYLRVTSLGPKDLEGEEFSYYYAESSKPWSPGISLFFDHPCEVEIAIPNHPEIDGVVILKVASEHPDAYMLERKFDDYESACKALAKFIGKNTVKILNQSSGLPKKSVFEARPSVKTSRSEDPMKKLGEIFRAEDEEAA